MSACECVSEAPEFFRQTWVKARKEHKCCECWKVINPGDEYQDTAGFWEGLLYTYKTCERCGDLRDALYEVVCPAYGELKKAYWEYLELINNQIWGEGKEGEDDEYYILTYAKCKAAYNRVFK